MNEHFSITETKTKMVNNNITLDGYLKNVFSTTLSIYDGALAAPTCCLRKYMLKIEENSIQCAIRIKYYYLFLIRRTYAWSVRRVPGFHLYNSTVK
jgi:hypothetical protein